MAKKSIEEKYITETLLTKQVCIDSAKHMIWHSWLFAPFIAVGIILLLTLPVYLYYGCPLGVALRTDVGFFPGVVLLLVIALLPRLLGRRLYEKNGGDQKVRMFFGANEVNVVSQAERRRFVYQEIRSYRQSKQYFFLSTGKKDALLYVIAKDSFIVGKAADFDSFLQSKIEK